MHNFQYYYFQKDVNFMRALSFSNFYREFIAPDFRIDFIPILESKYELISKGIDRVTLKHNPLIIEETSDDIFIIESVDELIRVIIEESDIRKIDVDAVIYGSGLDGIKEQQLLSERGIKSIIIDDEYFGKELINEGFSTSLMNSDTLSANMTLSRVIENSDTPILFPVLCDNISYNNSALTVAYYSFTITANKLIISDTKEPDTLGFSQVIAKNSNVYYDVYNNIEYFIDKRVLVIGEYNVNDKINIISKVAKKVTHINNVDSPFEVVKFFYDDSIITGALLKHKAGFSKPIKFDTVLFSVGYVEKDKFVTIPNNFKEKL